MQEYNLTASASVSPSQLAEEIKAYITSQSCLFVEVTGLDVTVGFTTALTTQEETDLATALAAHVIEYPPRDAASIATFFGRRKTTLSLNSTEWTDIGFDVSEIRDDIYAHSVGSAEIKLLKPTRYGLKSEVTAKNVTRGHGRLITRFVISTDNGTTFQEIPGSEGRDNNAKGELQETYASASFIYEADANSIIKLQGSVDVGSSNLALVEDQVRLIIKEG